MSTTIILTLLVGIVIYTVNGCPVSVLRVNGSCCEITNASNPEFKFSIPSLSRVYTITNFCGDCKLVS